MSDKKTRNEILEDIRFIKEALKNNSILRYIPIYEGIKNVALFSGIFIVVFCLAIIWIADYYGSYRNAPDFIKFAAFVVLGLTLIGLAYLKINTFLRLIRRYKEDISLKMIIKAFHTRTMMMVMTPFLMSFVIFWIYLSISGLSYLIVPVLAILMALYTVSIMVLLNFEGFLLFFVWLLLSGFLTLFIADGISSPVNTIITFGIGMFVQYFSSLKSISRKKRDKIGGE